jgi:predicted enzyme related to lactoylglutathione lyase
MIGTVDEVVIDCAQPAALCDFWAKVLGGAAVHSTPDWSYVDPPGWTRLGFQQVPEAKSGKNRLHIDVLVQDVAAGATQAVELGAVLVGAIQSDHTGSFQVLLDPEGNEWCVVGPLAS